LDFVVPLLLGQDEEEAVEELAFVEVGQIGDVDIFHRDDQGAARAAGGCACRLPAGQG